VPIYVFKCEQCKRLVRERRHASQVRPRAPLCDCGARMTGASQAKPRAAGWPIYSDALAVHPEQINDAERTAVERGVPTKFVRRDCPDKDLWAGQAIITSRKHQREFCQKVMRGNICNHDDNWSGRP
jgi:hypothetical protein